MKIIWTPPFERDFRDLPQGIQSRVEKVFALLIDNPRHPSLQAKKMKGLTDRWEARVTLSYRMTYEIQGEILVLRRIGTHDILKKDSA